MVNFLIGLFAMGFLYYIYVLWKFLSLPKVSRTNEALSEVEVIRAKSREFQKPRHLKTREAFSGRDVVIKRFLQQTGFFVDN